MIEILLAVLLIILIALVSVFGVLLLKRNSVGELERMEKRLNENLQGSVSLFRDTVAGNQQNIGRMQTAKFREMDIMIKDLYDTMESRLDGLSRSMGEMHTLAMGIDDLKKVLSNVKTRGILGEIQLEAILEEILAPEQYEKNVAVVPSSRNTVEFALKLPGAGDGCVYLPIDSKFPLDAYTALCDARDGGDTGKISAASKELMRRIKTFAKDVSTKYIAPPYTTDFAIIFLPTEGLYLEAVENGLVEMLQRDYKINIAGPSTLAAMLNALRMGFRTLAVEKRSVQVWEVLTEVRGEFEKFAATLESAQQHLRKAEAELDNAAGTRTRAILRKLRDTERTDI